jgi:serine/threonine-protein kinase
MQEARAASAIDHPNIGAVYEIGESGDGEPFIVMAYYEGINLKERIREGPLDVTECLSIGLQIARGMGEAHARGIIHRDLKPANIILTKQGLVKIIDFGLAKLTEGLQLTRTGTSLGTLAYMAPEQLRAGDVGAETDIWALGIILFEMLAGRHPFHGEFEAALMYSIAHEPPLALHDFRPDAPPPLLALIPGMLSKDRSGRISSMADVAGALEVALGGPAAIGSGSSVTGVAAGAPSETGRLRGRGWSGAAGRWMLAGAAIAGVAVAVFLLSRPEGAQKPPEAPPSIAVVPFTVTGEEDLRYLGEGLSGEVAGILSRWSNMTVISRKSASAFSGKPSPDSLVAHTLGVRYVLRGEIRITVARIFCETALYDHETRMVARSGVSAIARKDIAGLPGSIASDVAALAGSDLDAQAVRLPTSSSDAYESFLHGSYYREKLTKEANGLALVHFGEAVGSDSMYLAARIMLAGTLLEENLQGYTQSEAVLRRAEGVCREILKIDSMSDGALAILGKILDLKGEREEGLRMLNRSLEVNPANPYALTILGQMYIFETNEPLRGIVLLNKLRLLDPLDWLTNTNLGIAYAQSENHGEALASFRRAAALNPAHPYPPYSIGYLYEILGKPDSAALFYNSAIGLDPTFLQAYTSLAALYLADSAFMNAEYVATAGLRTNPGDHSLIYFRGLSTLFANRRDDARKILDEGYRLVAQRLAIDSGSVDLVVYSGLFAARLGNTREAQAAAELAAKLDSTHENSAMNIARIYAAAGLKSPAIKWFSRARAMNPEYDEAYLRTAIDFERLRTDPDLLLAARR